MTAKRTYRLLPREGAPPSPVKPEPFEPEGRRRMIAEAAYLRAASRGFVGGDAVADWLEAEREVDDRLARSTAHDESSSTARRSQT